MMTRSLLRGLLVAAGSLALIAPLAACSVTPPGEPTGGLAIVVGARANMPTADLQGVAAQVIDNAISAQSLVSLVVADGLPFVHAGRQLETTGEEADAWRASEAANRRALDDNLVSAAARTPESDLLGALSIAAVEIGSAPGRHTLLVVDSGLSTSGPMDFRQPGLLDANPADVVASLQASASLPDLRGIHVVFHGLGSTAAPQPELNAVQQTQLAEIWTAVALAAGAVEVHVEPGSLDGTAAADGPAVSAVGADAGLSCTADTVVLTGGNVAFAADSAVFRDPASATETLQPIADQIAMPGVTATLTGTTARVGDSAGQLRLSQQRAQAVADLLGSLGVPADRLTVVGLGSDFPGYVQDTDAQGNLLPAAAAQNRKVVIELSGTGTTLVCG